MTESTWNKDTVIARRNGDDWYHLECAPSDVPDYRAGDIEDPYDPEIMRRGCLECGDWIITNKTWQLCWDFLETTK